MKKITEIESIKNLEHNFHKVFKNKDPFTDCFTDNVQDKLLMFPTKGYYLQREQFDVLQQVISRFGETNFTISEIEGDAFNVPLSSESYEYSHFIMDMPSSTFEDYINFPIVIENAIYSAYGKWGLIISHEGHAILGGSTELIGMFKFLYPKYLFEKQKFIDHWKDNQKEYNSNIDWLGKFLRQFS